MAHASRLLVCSLLLVALSTTEAFAAGFTFPENLTRAMGRGGAWIAGVDDASALYLNPGALTRIERGSLLLNVNIIDHDLRFQRNPREDRSNPLNPLSFEYDEVRNESRPYIAPMLFGGMRVGDLPLVLATGIYGPSSVGRLRFPDPPIRDDRSGDESLDGGQRYMIIEQDVILFYPSIAAAWRFDDINLSLGITGQLAVTMIDYNIAIDGSHSNPTVRANGSVTVRDQLESETYLTRTRLDVSGAVPTLILGALWEPHPRFALGASWRPRFTVRSSGTIDVEFPPDLRGLSDDGSIAILNDDVRLEINFPHVVRLGALYRHLGAEDREHFNVELAGVYEGWSVLEEYVVRTDVQVQLPNLAAHGDQDPFFVRELPDLRLPKQYRDSVSIRLGGEFHPLHHNPETPRLSLRAGGFLETAATRPEYAHLDFLSPRRIGTSVGASWNVLHRSGAVSSIDVGFSMIFSPDIVLQEGEGRYDLLVPLWICGSPQTDAEREYCDTVAPEDAPGVGQPVNEGRYQSHMNIFSVGLSHRW
ncbi:MAG: hypothetical protein EA398_08080 [Deltaproteobacteria bacterium]|nr:MAG: hypothetical protein EA398_08080 [Deltaproteobacteria bacterium]